MSAKIDLSKPDRQIHIGVILMDSETEILDVAPIDLIHGLSKNFWKKDMGEFVPAEWEAQTFDMEFHWVSKNGPTSPSKLTSGINIVPTNSFETCPPLDIVLIGASTMNQPPDKAELAFIRKAWEECSAFLTICGGVMVPLQAGILKGRKATGPVIMLDTLRKQAPETNWVSKRWVRDGKLWTSGALLNGEDMMTNFVKHYWGGTYVDFLSKLGAWPDRDVDYNDVA
ncbi:hypothetical protein NW768_010611 [Fusarium equiseti]|uniref:DJ-1/PfpI domain-containing protein n=1 Tax=Fusarium equiseti TaxID=61235 RepID=A0ABQ8R043_FUSEQ|nr:hypothetical protein NW768_010611 [Fusarium equiseti]